VIDFRYHLVSLISVFLALAVGIVLGAGPLRENLGDQLAGQVEQLRTQQDELRTQADELASRNEQLGSFAAEIGPELVADTLAGQKVAVLTDDSSTAPVTDRLSALLEDAGVESTVRVELQSALWVPSQAQQRTDALDTIRSISPTLLDSGLTDSEQLSQVIVALLSPSESGELTSEMRTQVWQALAEQQLVTIEGELPPEVDGVLFASAAPEELVDSSEDEDVAAERAQSLQATQTALLTSLSGAGVPAVVSAETPLNDASTGILRTVRGNADFDELSTTDRLQEADGPLLAVLALIEQTRGGSGAYGTTTDAKDRLPAIPETAGVEDAAAEAGQNGDGAQGQGAASDGGGAE